MYRPIQETLSADVLVDKLLKKRTPIAEILSFINTCFSTTRVLDENYIIQRLQNIAKYQQQLGNLLRFPKVEQRSQEWHDLRKGLVTASEFAQALGKAKFGTQKDFYKKKCGYDSMPFNPAEEPLKWGTMYEDVAIAIYKYRYGYDIHEFGLLPHPSIKHFGASPDGINDFGVMVEIKCPYRRKITGEVPQQYYYQIQGQLSVCDLHECDYVECELEEYGDLETWLEVGTDEKGIVIERKTSDPLNPWTYEYSKVFHASDDIDVVRKAASDYIASQSNLNECDADGGIVVRFWILKVFNCVRVYRDDAFIKERFMELEPVWNKILTYREDYDSYKTEVATSRARKSSTISTIATTNTTNAHDKPLNDNINTLLPAQHSSSVMSTLRGYAFIDE